MLHHAHERSTLFVCFVRLCIVRAVLVLVLPPQSRQLPADDLKAMPTMVMHKNADNISDPTGKRVDDSGDTSTLERCIERW